MNKGKKNMNKKFILIVGLVVIGSLLFITGCPGVDTTKTETTNTDKKETATNENDSPIKKIDFKNFSYPLAFDAKIEKEKFLILKDGKSEKTEEANGAELGDVQYADLTGDKIEEAIINLGVMGEKDAKSNMVYVYTLENEKPKLLWNFETKGGEKVGLKEIKADNGKLMVEMFGEVKFNKGTFEQVDSKEKADGKTTKIELQWNKKEFEAVDGKPEAKEEKTKEKTT
jgi:hypothetical protein